MWSSKYGKLRVDWPGLVKEVEERKVMWVVMEGGVEETTEPQGRGVGRDVV